MHLEGKFDVNAEPAEVYAFLTDPRQVSSHCRMSRTWTSRTTTISA